jgi:hypothetical protein
MKKITGLLLSFFIFCGISAQKPPFYKNFTVSVYARAYEVRDMADQKKLQETWDLISRQVALRICFREKR